MSSIFSRNPATFSSRLNISFDKSQLLENSNKVFIKALFSSPVTQEDLDILDIQANNLLKNPKINQLWQRGGYGIYDTW
jgi:hypothetical protein